MHRERAPNDFVTELRRQYFAEAAELLNRIRDAAQVRRRIDVMDWIMNSLS